MWFAILVCIVSIFMLILGLRAIFLAFVKKKDERSKWIITKSMAVSFITITILQTMHFIAIMLGRASYLRWWNNFKEGIYIDPSFLSFMVFGIILIINTKKHGGSL